MLAGEAVDNSWIEIVQNRAPMIEENERHTAPGANVTVDERCPSDIYREGGCIYVTPRPEVGDRTSHGSLHCRAPAENPGIGKMFDGMTRLPLCAPVHILITPIRIAYAQPCRRETEEE